MEGEGKMARINLVTDDGVPFVVETTNMDYTEGVDALGVTWHEDEDGTWLPDDDSMTTATIIEHDN